MQKLYPIIGISPGNSYFKDEEITYLLSEVMSRFGRGAVLVADIPAIKTYQALGYPENRARRDKAIPKGNAIKNKVHAIATHLGIADSIRVIDWENEIEKNTAYQKAYAAVRALYEHNLEFRESVRRTTQSVLSHSQKKIVGMEAAVDVAVHYLLSEIAFLEYAPELLGTDAVTYVYHKNWSVYEQYISGVFDGKPRPYLDFLLLENPYETYNPMWGMEDYDLVINTEETVLQRVQRTGVLRAGFTHNEPSMMYDRERNTFSGIFYEVIESIAKKYGWTIEWREEIGYGVIEDGLSANRFDLFCTTVWPTAKRRARASFSTPVYYSDVYVYGRADDLVFKNSENILSSAHARIAVTEGDIQDTIAREDFPHARRVRIPQLADTKELLQCVVENKADATFVEPYLAAFFNTQSNTPVTALSTTPVRHYADTFMLRRDEEDCKQLLDQEIEALKKSGKVEEWIERYTGKSGTYSLWG